MKQQLKETVIYQPNDGVKITVNNKPVPDKKTGEIFYEQVVTVRVVREWMTDKLSFGTEDEVRTFLDDIELEDPQQSLPL